jgi:PAS domain S-box-containing protein
MDKNRITMDTQLLSRLFPFYIVIDHEGFLVTLGTDLAKLDIAETGTLFSQNFNIESPSAARADYAGLRALCNQVVVLGNKIGATLKLSGRLEVLENGHLLFAGNRPADKPNALQEDSLHPNIEAAHQAAAVNQRESELLDTTNRLSQLIANLESGIIVEDETGIIVLANDLYCSMFNLSCLGKDLIGRPHADLALKNKALFADPEGYVKDLARLVEQKVKSINQLFEMCDGRIFSRTYIPVTFENKYKGYLLKYTDVTQTKLIERKLESQKKFYEQVLNHIPSDIAVFDKDHRYMFVNPTAIKDDELRKWIIGKDDVEYVAYRNRDISIAKNRQALFNKAVKERKQQEIEEKIITNTGDAEYNLRRLFPVFDENGDLDMVIGYGVNITERRRIEEKVRFSETRYKNIFDYSLALICTHDLNGRILDANAAAIKTLGYPLEEITRHCIQDLVSPKHVDEFKQKYLRKILISGREEGIMLARSKEGKNVYLLYQNYLLNQDSGKPYIIGFAQNITDRIHAERALKKSEEKYRSIIANMDLGLIEIDNDKKIVYTNNCFTKMCGYSEQELLGKSFSDLFFFDEPGFKGKEIYDFNMFNYSGAYEIKTKNKDGEIKWWLFSEGTSMDENGNPNGFIGIFLDITLNKDLENELLESKHRTEVSARSKEIFLANMSHEIRTPMNAILGIGRLLQKTQLEPQQKAYLDTIHLAANNLLVILNDLLDFSKIESGKLTIEHIGFEIKKLLDTATDILRHKAEEKGLLLMTEIAPAVRPILIGDPYRISQILMNMIGNSIKFTENGYIKIEVLLLEDHAEYQELQFRIEDTGIGMSESFLSHMFNKFQQEDESITRKFGGTGLGMSISKQLIDLMAGTIDVKSAKNVGTVINFNLRFGKGTIKDLPKADDRAIDSKTLNGKNILLVEDNDMNRLFAKTLLIQYGAKVDEAGNGLIAIEKLEQGYSYDIILMDMQMPKMGGIEATRHIRQHIDSNIPIIALTANAFKQEEERCLEAGMNDFIAKPFDENKFIRLVAEWLGKEIIKPEAPHEVVEHKVQLYDLSKLNAISNGDKVFIFKMLELFVNSIPDTMEAMKAALENGDLKTVAENAHRIKPTLQNLGIASIESEIKMLESGVVLGLDPQHVHKYLIKVVDVLHVVVADLVKVMEKL